MHTAQKELMLMAAAASAMVGISGMAAVAISAAIAQIQQTRIRAEITRVPPRIQRNAIHPPKNPPKVENTGGIHANRLLAASCVRCHCSTKYSVVQLLHSVYRPIMKTVETTSPHNWRSASTSLSRACVVDFAAGRAGIF